MKLHSCGKLWQEGKELNLQPCFWRTGALDQLSYPPTEAKGRFPPAS